MSKLILMVLLVSGLAAPVGRTCSCRKASENDIPHGANVNIEYAPRTVKRISGRVTYHYLEEPVADAVVEVYDLIDADKDRAAYEIIARRTPRTACVTASDGTFCFPDVPSGKYLLRAGTGGLEGMNEAHIRVTVDRRWWRNWLRSGKPIEMGLTPGI